MIAATQYGSSLIRRPYTSRPVGVQPSPCRRRRTTSVFRLALVCPITSHVKGYPFEVVLPATGRVRGAVLADQVKSLDWRMRRAQRLGRVPADLLEQVLMRIEALLRG